MTSAFSLTFTPPSYAPVAAAPDPDESYDPNDTGPDRESGTAAAPLRMSKGARAAATADRISEEQIREALAAPDSVDSDDTGSGRMKMRKGTLMVVVARDGAILSVRNRR